MTVLEQNSNPHLASPILGLLCGLTFCASACLPHIISSIAGIEAGFKKDTIVTSIYNSVRTWVSRIGGAPLLFMRLNVLFNSLSVIT